MRRLSLAESSVRILDWNLHIESNPGYRSCLDSIKALYDSNAAFRSAVNQTVENVLTKSRKLLPAPVQSVRQAALYLLSEIAFLESAPSFLQCERVVYVYHNPWPIFEDYRSGAFDGKPKKHLGFAIIR